MPAIAMAVAVATAMAMTACGGGEADDRILVLAASSLTEAFTQIGELAEVDGISVEFSFAGSQILMEQVRQGAPADVIAVADPTLFPDHDDALVFARNRVVIVTQEDSTIDGVDDLTTDGTRVVLATESVPVGKYAREGLDQLGLLDPMLGNVVSEEPDVKSVVAKVALGEADAGIVYATDANADDRLRIVGEPLPVETAYAAAVVDDATDPAAARRFLAILASQDAQKILERLGFVPA